MGAWRTRGSICLVAVTGILVSVLALAAGPPQHGLGRSLGREKEPLHVAASDVAASDSLGTDFWLAFIGNAFCCGTPTLTLFITGPTATNGTVSIPGLGFATNFAVIPGTITAVAIPLGAHLTSSDMVEGKGIHVTALGEVTVYGLNQIPFTTDAYLGLPTDVLGTEYIVLGYQNSNVILGTEFGVVATQHDTTVTITPTVTTGARAAGVAYNVALNQGQTYQLVNSTTLPGDLSGTVITSDKPIAVFAGQNCANIPTAPDGTPLAFACDHVVEQLPPTSAWGKSFVTMPLATRLNGDTFRFLASTDGTHVSFNGTEVATLNRGEVHEQLIDGPAQITADQPILVAQYSNGTSFDGVTSDPFMMLIPPFEQFLTNYTVTTPASGFAINFINVVAPAAAVGSIKLDGTAIPAESFTPIGASGFSGAQVPVGLGTHTLTSNPFPFGVFVYGFASADSYGYPGGASYAPVALVTNVALTPESATNAVNSEHCVTATVTDQNNDPLEGVRVDFAVTGANETVGSANTDANGQAQFCYTGTNAGDDTITASVGNISDAATKTWQVCQEDEACLIVGGPEDFTYDVNGRSSEGIRVHVTVTNAVRLRTTKTAQVFVDGPCTPPLGPSNELTWVQENDASTGAILSPPEIKQANALVEKLKKLSAVKRQALLAAAANGSGDFFVKIASLNPDTLTVARQHNCLGPVRLVTTYTMDSLDSLGNVLKSVRGSATREWSLE